MTATADDKMFKITFANCKKLVDDKEIAMCEELRYATATGVYNLLLELFCSDDDASEDVTECKSYLAKRVEHNIAASVKLAANETYNAMQKAMRDFL